MSIKSLLMSIAVKHLKRRNKETHHIVMAILVSYLVGTAVTVTIRTITEYLLPPKDEDRNRADLHYLDTPTEAEVIRSTNQDNRLCISQSPLFDTPIYKDEFFSTSLVQPPEPTIYQDPDPGLTSTGQVTDTPLHQDVSPCSSLVQISDRPLYHDKSLTLCQTEIPGPTLSQDQDVQIFEQSSSNVVSSVDHLNTTLSCRCYGHRHPKVLSDYSYVTTPEQELHKNTCLYMCNRQLKNLPHYQESSVDPYLNCIREHVWTSKEREIGSILKSTSSAVVEQVSSVTSEVRRWATVPIHMFELTLILIIYLLMRYTEMGVLPYCTTGPILVVFLYLLPLLFFFRLILFL